MPKLPTYARPFIANLYSGTKSWIGPGLTSRHSFYHQFAAPNLKNTKPKLNNLHNHRLNLTKMYISSTEHTFLLVVDRSWGFKKNLLHFWAILPHLRVPRSCPAGPGTGVVVSLPYGLHSNPNHMITRPIFTKCPTSSSIWEVARETLSEALALLGRDVELYTSAATFTDSVPVNILLCYVTW